MRVLAGILALATVAAAALAASFLVTGGPARAAETEQRSLSGFKTIEISGGIDLTVRQGPDFGVEVQASGSAHAVDVVTEIDGDTLEIRYLKSIKGFGWFSGNDVVVTLPELVAVNTSTSTANTSTASFSNKSCI